MMSVLSFTECGEVEVMWLAEGQLGKLRWQKRIKHKFAIANANLSFLLMLSYDFYWLKFKWTYLLWMITCVQLV